MDNKALTQEFNSYYPGGHSNLNISWEFNFNKIFIERSEGQHLFAADGREFLDYNCAMGPDILGHRNPEIIEGIKNFLDRQDTTYGAANLFTTDDIEYAKAITRNVPCAEQIKLCVTGTEAVQMTIRIARAYTGKTRILRFDSHYHGWMDNILGDTARADIYNQTPLAEDDIPTTAAHYTEGQSPWSKNEALVIPYNDFEALDYVMEKYHDELAIVHFEAVVCNHFAIRPKEGYLEKIREYCDKYNIVMSIDEIITGFRTGLGGAQALLGVTPDICTMGKAIGGGMPISVIAGKKKIMSVFQEKTILAPGTFNGYALGVNTSLNCIRILERNDGQIYKDMAARQEKLLQGFLKLAADHGIDLRISAVPNVFFLMFGAKGGISPAHGPEDLVDVDKKFLDAFRSEMLKEGILTLSNLRYYMSAGHTDDDIEKTLEASDRALTTLLGR